LKICQAGAWNPAVIRYRQSPNRHVFSLAAFNPAKLPVSWLVRSPETFPDYFETTVYRSLEAQDDQFP
jgi:hypothetical protein